MLHSQSTADRFSIQHSVCQKYSIASDIGCMCVCAIMLCRTKGPMTIFYFHWFWSTLYLCRWYIVCISRRATSARLHSSFFLCSASVCCIGRQPLYHKRKRLSSQLWAILSLLACALAWIPNIRAVGVRCVFVRLTHSNSSLLRFFNRKWLRWIRPKVHISVSFRPILRSITSRRVCKLCFFCRCYCHSMAFKVMILVVGFFFVTE